MSPTIKPLDCREYYPQIYTDPNSASDRDGSAEERNEHFAPLYKAVRRMLHVHFGFDPADNTASEPSGFPRNFDPARAPTGTTEDLLGPEKLLFLSVYGQLVAGGFDSPLMGRDPATAGRSDDDAILFGANSASKVDDIVVSKRWVERATGAVQQYLANKLLYDRVYETLIKEGAELNDDGLPKSFTLDLAQYAEIAGRLVDNRTDPENPQLRRLILNALSASLTGGFDGRASDVNIDFPDLDGGAAVDIIAPNVRAVALIYFSAMLEEMKMYAVADKVAEHFMIGMLPLSRSFAGNKIFDWLKKAPERFSELERRGVYGRVLGLATGSAQNVMPNREFADLWLRFLSSVSVHKREDGAYLKRETSEEQLYKAARDLGVNLSLHGYGVAHFAAVEMQTLVRTIKDMLSSAELLTAYGVNDCWQLIERVSQMYLGGAANGVRYRTMARAGGDIIKWLADNATKLTQSSIASDVDWLDPRLVRPVEQWLAVTGTPDTTSEKYVEPVDLASQPTIPQFAPMNGAGSVQRVLERVGAGALPAVPALPVM